jgi:predicted dehydrogenase
VISERVVVVGAGDISNRWFAPLREENVEIVAVVDLRLESATSQIAKYALAQAAAYTDFKEALRKHKPDFVLDLTVPSAHATVVGHSLKAGYHVLGEKPMATSMAEARRMVAASERYGRMYMVGQSKRFDPLADSARRTLAAGRIGQLTTVNCDFYAGRHFYAGRLFPNYRELDPNPLMTEMGIHHFDLARFITGAEPVAVYAKEFNPRGSWFAGPAAATCLFEMSDGSVFTYRGSWSAEGCETSWSGNWRLVGTEGTILWEQDQEPRGEIVRPGGNREGIQWELEPVEIEGSDMPFSSQRQVLREMLDFLRSGKVPSSECHDNIKSLGMMFSAIESSRRGRWVPTLRS